MKIALAGNPNSGKTTLFNALTGSTARVGNWPGVTVDKKTGVYKKKGKRAEIVDLPGIYSLSPYTPEEIVARDYLLDGDADVVVNIVDATNLERNLYLTTQILETELPVVIALNMIDVVRKNGDKIDVDKLSDRMGVPVVPISALRGEGIDALIAACGTAALRPRKGQSVFAGTDLGNTIDALTRDFAERKVKSPLFHAVKLIENDPAEVERHPDLSESVARFKAARPRDAFENDYEAIVADRRYRYLGKLLSGVQTKEKQGDTLSKSDKIDRVLTHRIWGIPIFLVIMFFVFHLTFSENLLFLGAAIPEGSFDIPVIGTDAVNSPGAMLFNAMDLLTSTIADATAGALASSPAWVQGLIVDGLMGGVFAVLSFIPQIAVLFLFLSILEDSGYMARVAFIMDRAFRRFGLSGKSFIPLLTCFGCAIPGIMATRTLENEKERRMTILLAPFFSCGAKMPIWATFGALMFAGRHGDLVVYAMYLIGIVVAILAAILLKKTAFKGETAPFIMELPSYRLPQFRNTMAHLFEKVKHYLLRAATVIAAAVIVIWVLTSFDFRFQMVEAGDSIIGQIAKVFDVLFVPLGFGQGSDGWKFVVAAFTGLIAKEMVVATLGTFAGMDDALDLEASALAGTPIAVLIGTISVPAAFAFMAFNLLSVPCMAAVAAAKGELGGRGRLWGAIGFWMLTAYVVSMLIYLIGTYWWVSLIVAGLIGIAVLLGILHKKGMITLPTFKAKRKGAKQ